MLQKIQNMRAKKLFYRTVLITGLIGTINLIINYTTFTQNFYGDAGWKIPFAFASVFILALIVQAAYVVALALICYFACAAMNTGYEIKTFIRLAAKALVITPWLNLTDTIGFVFFGRKLVDMGLVGLLSYIPFYLGVAYLIFYFAPHYVPLDRRKCMILSLVSGLAIIFLSYPN